ncbi:hypothetical protein QBC46DRAFT_405471 [Diplogelasinospora grovesii]|uniref:Uncharacterized protein n=1 Tax=Diplogelasinospora grovesii TaxID=303347 RepID=A0AAN6S7K0_9PEZI|nr:hypothetical protein QBC46DRAFT_405471 [Diplogelasinospora grovesii]
MIQPANNARKMLSVSLASLLMTLILTLTFGRAGAEARQSAYTSAAKGNQNRYVPFFCRERYVSFSAARGTFSAISARTFSAISYTNTGLGPEDSASSSDPSLQEPAESAFKSQGSARDSVRDSHACEYPLPRGNSTLMLFSRCRLGYDYWRDGGEHEDRSAISAVQLRDIKSMLIVDEDASSRVGSLNLEVTQHCGALAANRFRLLAFPPQATRYSLNRMYRNKCPREKHFQFLRAPERDRGPGRGPGRPIPAGGGVIGCCTAYTSRDTGSTTPPPTPSPFLKRPISPKPDPCSLLQFF